MNQSYLYPNYARMPLRFARGQGCKLYSESGVEYLDFAAGIAVMSLGHSHPVLVNVLKQQAESLWHVSNLFESSTQEKLAKLLCENSFADKVFFTNSGTEALECAFKTARKYHYANGNKNKQDIITFKGAFHGRSLACIAATGNEQYLEGFGQKAAGFIQVPFNDFEKLQQTINENTAAILIEPIQGEGGIRDVPYKFLRQLRQLCNNNDILLIYDEVQSGTGRTGKLFAYQWANNAEPDIMAIAKGIGGGFPLGACLAKQHVANSMVAGSHGSTYGGNALAVSIGLAVLCEVLKEDFLQQVQLNAAIFRQGLAELLDKYPNIIKDIRGQGLLIGLGCHIENKKLVAAFLQEKLLSVGAGDNVVRLLPPLIVDGENIRDALARMDIACANIAKERT